MDDVTQLSRPRPRLAPRFRLTADEFLKEYERDAAEWMADGMVHILPEESMVATQLRLDLAELLGVYLHVTGWGHLLMGFKQVLGTHAAIRQPDIMLVAHAQLERVSHNVLHGAADIAIEVTTPESFERDSVVKFHEYEAAGIREYWLIDPDRQVAEVYELGDDAHYTKRPPDEHGRVTSGLLPHFAFDPAIFWADVPPTSADHLRFVADMLDVPVDTLLK